MDIEMIDRSYNQLEGQSQQTIEALTALVQKLQAATQAGDQNAREWMLDLKEIALGIKEEQDRVTALLQAIHEFAATQLQPPPAPNYAQAPYQQVPYPQTPYTQVPYQPAPPQYQQPGYSGGGGTLQRFLSGGFGRAIATGAGFGIGDDLINHLFN